MRRTPEEATLQCSRDQTARMKRLHPLMLLALFAVLLVAGIVRSILDADECMERGGMVVAPMTRVQDCGGR